MSAIAKAKPAAAKGTYFKSATIATTIDVYKRQAPEEPDDGPARYEVTCPACGATSVVDEEALLDGEPVCPDPTC